MLVKENVFKGNKRGLPSPFTWISDGLISDRKKAKWHIRRSCFTLKVMTTVFHAKREEFCVMSLHIYTKISLLCTYSEMGGRWLKLYPQGIKLMVRKTHVKPFREQVKTGYELAQVC